MTTCPNSPTGDHQFPTGPRIPTNAPCLHCGTHPLHDLLGIPNEPAIVVLYACAGCGTVSASYRAGEGPDGFPRWITSDCCPIGNQLPLEARRATPAEFGELALRLVAEDPDLGDFWRNLPRVRLPEVPFIEAGIVEPAAAMRGRI